MAAALEGSASDFPARQTSDFDTHPSLKSPLFPNSPPSASQSPDQQITVSGIPGRVLLPRVLCWLSHCWTSIRLKPPGLWLGRSAYSSSHNPHTHSVKQHKFCSLSGVDKRAPIVNLGPKVANWMGDLTHSCSFSPAIIQI